MATPGSVRSVSERPKCSYCKRMGHTWEKCYSLCGFPKKTEKVSKCKNSEHMSSIQAQSSPAVSNSFSVSTACISQSIGSQGPWIINSGASDHISGNSSRFTSLSPLKFPHPITLANGTKVASKGIGQVSLSPSLNLKSVLYVPNCPYNLISLSQLTKSLNCFVKFDVDSFVIQEVGTGRLIVEGHESKGLYYLQTNPFVSYVATLSPKLLHDHLGHPNLSKLKKMVPGLDKLQMLECSMSTRQTFDLLFQSKVQ